MKPLPVAIDTNVLVSGLITADEHSPVCLILDATLAGRIVFLLSADLLDEYREVLLRPKIKKLHGLGEREIDKVLTDVVSNGIWWEPTGPAAAPDPGDNHLWWFAQDPARQPLGNWRSAIVEAASRLFLRCIAGNIHQGILSSLSD